jgi:aminopeptidase N
VEHIALDLVLDLAQQQCYGTCRIRLQPIRSDIQTLVLDAVGQRIERVEVNNTSQLFDYDGKELLITLSPVSRVGQTLEIVIGYRLDRPQRGLYFIQPNPAYPHKPTQVWTQGEDEDSRYWFPCFDYPGQLATSEIRVQVPEEFLAISNGELIATQAGDGHRIYHWLQKQIHPTYLMTLVVGRFATIQDQWRDKPVVYYVEAGQEEDAQRTLGKTPAMIEFFSQQFGYAYPFPKYAQVFVEDFIFGGMENTSTTLLTDRCLLDQRAALDNRSAETLVAHELAHQWFGDLLVIKHWSHAWLKEGMATYSETLWIDQAYGAEEAAYYQLRTARAYLEEDGSRYRRPMVTHIYREPIELYDSHIYEKGACICHLIRYTLGDELFWRSIQAFVQTHAHKTVETIDLVRTIEATTGLNLMFLFDQYVFRGGHPDYKVAFSWDKDSQLAKVTVIQTQAKPENQGKDCFDLKIPLSFGYLLDSEPLVATDIPQPFFKTFTVRVQEAEQSFYFPLDKKPLFISFDRHNATLKTLVLDYPLPELKAQLRHDPDPVSRIYAAEALANPGASHGGREVVQTLAQALTTDPFWGVRAEAAGQLARVKLDQSLEVLLPGLADPEARVRKAVVEAIAQFKLPQAYQALKTIAQQGDASYYVEASAIRCLGAFTRLKLGDQTLESEIIDLLRDILSQRAGWNEVVRSGAIGALSQIKTSEAALDLLLDYTALGIPQPLRLAAIRALGAISPGQAAPALERIFNRLGDLSRETFFLTQMALIRALRQMEKPQAITLLQQLADQTSDGRVKRAAEEAVTTVQAKVGSEPAVKKMREELDQLKQDNQQLRSRLEALEALK